MCQKTQNSSCVNSVDVTFLKPLPVHTSCSQNTMVDKKEATSWSFSLLTPTSIPSDLIGCSLAISLRRRFVVRHWLPHRRRPLIHAQLPLWPVEALKILPGTAEGTCGAPPDSSPYAKYSRSGQISTPTIASTRREENLLKGPLPWREGPRPSRQLPEEARQGDVLFVRRIGLRQLRTAGR